MKRPKDPSRFTEPKRTTSEEVVYRVKLNKFIKESLNSNVEKFQNFSLYTPTQDIRKFIVRYELFKKILNVHGSIIECGILYGNGLMTWAHLSEIFEPVNHLRKIVGFDTFKGFSNISTYDKQGMASQNIKGGLAIDTFKTIKKSIGLLNETRMLKHIEKVKPVKGDIVDTLPKYLDDNPYLVVSLLWLDFDVYEPTIFALKHLKNRIPKGGIIAFDELNHEVWPGETIAVMEELGINNLKIERFPFGSTLSYAVIQ